MSIQLFADTVQHLRLPTFSKPLRSVVTCLVFASLLSACSDDGSTVIVEGVDSVAAPGAGPDAVDQPPGEGIDGTPVVIPTGDPSDIVGDATSSPLPPGTRAQTYSGTFDTGDGVFVLDDSNRLLGLVFDRDGNARSVRSDLGASNQSTGVFRQFTYSAKSSSGAVQLMPFAQGSETTTEAMVEIVDGQSIDSLTSELALSLSVATANDLLPVSSNSLQGSWTSAYTLCDSLDQNCTQFLMQFNITGDQIEGSSSVIAADGTDLLPSAVRGSIAQRGSVMDVSFRWNTYVYSGFAYVNSANTNQLMLVATTDSEIADERILASSLVRLR